MKIFTKLENYIKQKIKILHAFVEQWRLKIIDYLVSSITSYAREKKRRINDKINRSFGAKIAIDFGTANTMISIAGGKFILNEPTIAAIRYNGESMKILAIGDQAVELLSKNKDNIKAIRPLRFGSISNFFVAEYVIKKFITKAVKQNKYLLFDSKAIVSIPTYMTLIEKKIIKQAVLKSGIKRVQLIEHQMATALGIGLHVATPHASMIINIGGGTMGIFLISLNGIVLSHILSSAGHSMTELLVGLVRRKHGTIITEKTAETAKIALSSIFPLGRELSLDVMGRDVARGQPKIATISSMEIRELFQNIFKQLGLAAGGIVSQIPPELSADISELGIFVCGGGSKIKDIDKFLTAHCKVRVQIAQDSTYATLDGIWKIFENSEIYTKLFM